MCACVFTCTLSAIGLYTHTLSLSLSLSLSLCIERETRVEGEGIRREEVLDSAEALDLELLWLPHNYLIYTHP